MVSHNRKSTRCRYIQSEIYKMIVTRVHARSDHPTLPLATVKIKFKLNSSRASGAIVLLIGCIEFVFMPAFGD